MGGWFGRCVCGNTDTHPMYLLFAVVKLASCHGVEVWEKIQKQVSSEVSGRECSERQGWDDHSSRALVSFSRRDLALIAPREPQSPRIVLSVCGLEYGWGGVSG